MDCNIANCLSIDSRCCFRGTQPSLVCRVYLFTFANSRELANEKIRERSGRWKSRPRGRLGIRVIEWVGWAALMRNFSLSGTKALFACDFQLAILLNDFVVRPVLSFGCCA